MFGAGWFGKSYDGAGYFGPGAGAVAPTGRSKDYSIGGIPIPFTDDAYDSALDRMREKRRQILHEDQLAIDIIVQAVTSRIIR